MADNNVYVNNTKTLMKEIGSKNSGKIQKIVEDYEKINSDWNKFLDDQIQKIDPSYNPIANSKSEDEKISDLAQKTYYYDDTKKQDFKSELKKQLTARDNGRLKLKDIAEEALKKQYDLIKKNKEIIKELSDSLQADIEKKNKLDAKIKQLDEEKSDNDNKIAERQNLISTLETEISKLDPDKDKSTIIAKRKQIQSYRNDVLKLSDRNNKITEKDKIETGDNRQKEIDDLNNINKDLEYHFNENYNDLNKQFSADGITINHPGRSNEAVTPGAPQLEGDNERENGNSNPEAQQTRGTSGGVSNGQPDTQNNQLVKLSEKQIAANMAREFRNMTLNEQKNMLNGYGYNDLVAMTSYLRLTDKKRMNNALRESIAEMDVPKLDDFKNKISQVPNVNGDMAEQWYNLIFNENNEPRYLKDLEVVELRQIQKAIDTVNENRNEIGKTNPELLDYFDKNFVQFVQKGSLIERVKTGRIKGFFADMFNGKQKAVRDKLSASMRDYCMARSDAKTASKEYENDIRRMLGKEVIPDNERRDTRSNTRYDNELQKLDRQNLSR